MGADSFQEIEKESKEIVSKLEKSFVSTDEVKDKKDIAIKPGFLKVIVFEASELVNKDMLGKSDPYVKIKFRDQEFKSRKVSNTLEPEWNFSANLIVTSSDENSDILLEVYDDDYGKEDFIGSYTFSLEKAIKETDKEAVWYNLVGCKSGKISVSTIYSPDEEPATKPIKEKEGDQTSIQKDSKDTKDECSTQDSFIKDIKELEGKQEVKKSSKEKDESEEKIKVENVEDAFTSDINKSKEDIAPESEKEQGQTTIGTVSLEKENAVSKEEKVCSVEDIVDKVSLKEDKVTAGEKEEEKPTVDVEEKTPEDEKKNGEAIDGTKPLKGDKEPGLISLKVESVESSSLEKENISSQKDAVCSKDEKIPVSEKEKDKEEKVCPAEIAVDKVSLNDGKTAADEKQEINITDDRLSLKDEKFEKKEEPTVKEENKSLKGEKNDDESTDMTKAAVSKDEKIPIAENRKVESAISEEKVCPAEIAVDKVSLKDEKSSADEKQENNLTVNEVSLKNEKAER